MLCISSGREAAQEIKTREEKRKQETIAKIKQLAGAVGVSVSIGGARGWPANHKGRPLIKKSA